MNPTQIEALVSFPAEMLLGSSFQTIACKRMNMSTLISCQNLVKSFSSDPLFENLNLTIQDGEKIGIVGPNGCGKSTLLKMMAGLESHDEGEIVKKRNMKANYCAQEHTFSEESDIWSLSLQKAAELHVDASMSEGEVGVWLGKAGFESFEKKPAELSGGWRKRLGIVHSLLGSPDLVFMDEPTNHLDFEGIQWLQDLLKQASFTYVLISHDRAFLESTCNRIIEINPYYPEGYLSHEGGYKDFVEFREKYFEDTEQYEKSLATKVRRESAWLKQGVKARTTKSQSRIDQAHAFISELSALKKRRLAKAKKVGIEFQASGRKSKQLIEINHAEKTLGQRKILNDFSISLNKFQKLGLLGPNGSGKTTILKLLNEEEKLDQGTYKSALDCKIVYFDQKRDALNEEWTLKRALAEEGDSVVFNGRSIHVVTWAQRFRFSVDQLKLPVKQLSGGEKARLLIARLMLRPADVLLLDEPTNDLDLDTLELLEENLLDFDGCLVLVTHDRFMLEKVCDQFLALDGQGNTQLVQSLNQWKAWLEEVESSQTKSKSQGTSDSQNPRVSSDKKSMKKKLSYMDQREFDQLEGKILEAESTVEDLESVIADPKLASNSKKLAERCEELELAKKEVERLYSRWSELEGKMS